MTDRQFLVLTQLLMELVTLTGEVRDLTSELRDLILGAAQTEEPDGCTHPEQERISLASAGDPDHWVCRGCKHEHKGIPMH